MAAQRLAALTFEENKKGFDTREEELIVEKAALETELMVSGAWGWWGVEGVTHVRAHPTLRIFPSVLGMPFVGGLAEGGVERVP